MLRCTRLAVFILLVLLVAPLHAQESPTWTDPSPHIRRFVTVDGNVRLEVLDWGGTGTPVVLLAGGGDTAHVFDEFALNLTVHHHVYGITRRGFGASGYSAADYGSDRLGDDVLEVLDSLRLNRPVLMGHSIAGEELSSIASRRPDRIAGVVYLDAAYPYAFDNGKGPSFQDYLELQPPERPAPSAADLASFRALQKYLERVDGIRYPEGELHQEWESTSDGRVVKQRNFPGGATLIKGMKKYTNIPVAVLAIFANPHSIGAWVNHSTDSAVQNAAKDYTIALTALTDRQIKVFRDGVPTARVITMPGAHHYVYLSNEAEVLGAIRAFLRE
jgi:pimeloyl-ACP methyl ester carboxylesterase